MIGDDRPSDEIDTMAYAVSFQQAAERLADTDGADRGHERRSIAPVNQLLTAPRYYGVGHSGRACWLTASFRRACAPMALDPEEIVTLLLLAALAIAWNWRLGH